MIAWPELEGAWCAATSATPLLWRDDNPAYGQCAVTALIVQDYFGGILVRADNEGVEVDTTQPGAMPRRKGHSDG